MGQYPLLRCGDATIGTFSSGVVVRGSGSAQWWERAGAEAARMGLLGRSGAGACPDLLQRRSGPGEVANESAEYQRFFSRAPARSGPLQQIWTNGAATGPAGSTGTPIGQADPAGTDRRGPSSGWRGPDPACAMRARRNIIHPTSRHASSARHNPPALDPREPASHNTT